MRSQYALIKYLTVLAYVYMHMLACKRSELTKIVVKTSTYGINSAILDSEPSISVHSGVKGEWINCLPDKIHRSVTMFEGY